MFTSYMISMNTPLAGVCTVLTGMDQDVDGCLELIPEGK